MLKVQDFFFFKFLRKKDIKNIVFGLSKLHRTMCLKKLLWDDIIQEKNQHETLFLMMQANYTKRNESNLHVTGH